MNGIGKHLATFNLFREADNSLQVTIADARGVPEYLNNLADHFAATGWPSSVAVLRKAAAALNTDEERIRRLEGALEPFARMGELIETETDGFDDRDELHLIVESGHLLDRFSVVDFRRARAALSTPSKEVGR
jgi:hypothetical protein